MATPETLRDRFGAPFTSLPLSGQNTETEQAASTPGVVAGSFLLGQDQDSRSIRVLPTDPDTELPLPILPTYVPPATERGYSENYHHHFYFRRDPDLEGDLRETGVVSWRPEDIPLAAISGLSVRMSRGQMLPVGTHEELHRRFKAGPEPPRTQEAKFRIAVLACAGVISRYALDFTQPYGEEVVEINDEQVAYFSSPRTLLTEKQYYDRPGQSRREVISSFFVRYAAAQDLGHITERVINEFISTSDVRRKRELGGLILREAISQSVEPIHPKYKELSSLGVVPSNHPDPRAVVQKLIRVRPVHRIVSELSASLDGSLLNVA